MSLADFTNPATFNSPTAIEGVIADTATSPTDTVRVLLPSFDDEQAFGPCPFMPRVDAAGDYVPPQIGDRCLVVMSDVQAPWIVAYQPA